MQQKNRKKIATLGHQELKKIQTATNPLKSNQSYLNCKRLLHSRHPQQVVKFVDEN
jgi:hypothetical protein